MLTPLVIPRPGAASTVTDALSSTELKLVVLDHSVGPVQLIGFDFGQLLGQIGVCRLENLLDSAGRFMQFGVKFFNLLQFDLIINN